MGGPDATTNLWKQLFSAVRASGGYPGNACTFGEKIAQFGISRFQVIIVLHQSQMIIDIVEFTSYESFFRHLIITTMSK